MTKRGEPKAEAAMGEEEIFRDPASQAGALVQGRSEAGFGRGAEDPESHRNAEYRKNRRKIRGEERRNA